MRTRSLHTKIWTDPWFLELPSFARLFFIYLLTNSSINFPAIYELSEKQIILETALTKDLIQKAKVLLKDKILFRGNWIILKNIDRYDNYSGGKLLRAKELQLQKIPNNIIEAAESFRNSVSIGYQNLSDTPNSNSNSNSKEGGVRRKQSLDDPELLVQLKAQFPTHDVELEVASMKDWLKANGKRKEDYAAFARNWLRKATPKSGQQIVIVR